MIKKHVVFLDFLSFPEMHKAENTYRTHRLIEANDEVYKYINM